MEEAYCFGCQWYSTGGECMKKLQLPEDDEECCDYEEEGFGETWF